MNNVRFVIKSVLLVLCCLVLFGVSSQADVPVGLPDTLQRSLRNAPNDSVRIQKLALAAMDCQAENPKQAFLYLNKALDLSGKNQENVAKVRYKMAVIYFFHDDYLNSIQTGLMALENYKNMPHEIGIANTKMLLGNDYLGLEKYQTSEQYYQQALELYYKNNKQENIAMCLNNIANLHFSQKHYQQAIENYQKSLEINLAIANNEQVALCQNNIAIAYEAIGQYADSEKMATQALSLATKTNSDYNKCMAYNTLAEAHLGLNHYEEAEQYAQKSLQMALKIQSILRQKEAFEVLKDIAKRQKKYKEAFFFLEKCNQLKDSLNNEEIRTKVKQIETQQAIKLQQAQITSLQKDKKIQQEILDNERLHKYLLFVTLFFVMLILLITVIGLRRMIHYNKENKRQKEEATIRNNELEQQKEEIQSQAEFARKLNDEFYELNLELLKAMREIEQKNEQLNEVNENLDNLVKQRTQEIAAKNKRILDFVFMCAHQFRAPVARILGLSNLLDLSSLPENETDLLARMKVAAQELDGVVRQMQQTLENEALGQIPPSSENEKS